MTVGNGKVARITIAIILVIGIIIPGIANATLIKLGYLNGNTRITGPVIWYNETGASKINVSFTPYRQKANITAVDYNWALHIYDHSNKEGIIVYKDWIIDTGGGEKLKSARTKLVFFGANITSDPDNTGVVITEIEISGESGGQSCIAFFSFYYFKNKTLRPSFEVADTTGGHYNLIDRERGSPIQINGWDYHTAYILLTYNRHNSNKTTVTWKLDGITVFKKRNYNIGSLCPGISQTSVSYVSINSGLFDPVATYDMFIDNISLRVRTSDVTHTLSEKFGDGIDNHLERTYTLKVGSNVSTVDEPSDTKVGSYIEYATSEPVLAVETSLSNGSVLESRLKLVDGFCYSEYNSRSTPIEVEDIDGVNHDSITVLVNLSSANFNGWSEVSPEGSDIYFTDAKGHPLYYWIEYLDTSKHKGLILVNVTNLPGFSRKTIYMHYGGTNIYESYRDPDKVYQFYDDFDYTDLNDMASSGKWKIVNSNQVINVSNGNVYIETGNNIYPIRTTSQFSEPLTIVYALSACKNNSVDWDSGIALGGSKTGSVMFVDDMNVPGSKSAGGYYPNYLAIAPYAWSPISHMDKLPDTDARRDRNWIIPHVYTVSIASDLSVWFNDTSDGRWNYNESLDNIKSNVLPGYIWLVNDGDDDDNCAIYHWIGVLPYSVSSQDIYRVHVMEDSEPLTVEYMENTSETGWSLNPIYVTGYDYHFTGSASSILGLTVNSSISPGNLSRIGIFSSQPAGARTGCVLRVSNPYYLNPSARNPLIVFLEHEIKVSARN